MVSYEYRVLPAPARGIKLRGARTGAERLAAALTEAMNAMARDGWEYVRADMLPSEERKGLTGRATVYHNLLVFRRRIEAAPAPLRLVAQAGPSDADPARTMPPLHAQAEGAPPPVGAPDRGAEPPAGGPALPGVSR
ncbi:MAG: DUF4177 domain-containing protein [Paracoccaceae bacterium]